MYPNVRSSRTVKNFFYLYTFETCVFTFFMKMSKLLVILYDCLLFGKSLVLMLKCQ
jgi:hypothetical protein